MDVNLKCMPKTRCIRDYGHEKPGMSDAVKLESSSEHRRSLSRESCSALVLIETHAPETSFCRRGSQSSTAAMSDLQNGRAATSASAGDNYRVRWE
jgi:hypothetical protein